MLDSVRGLHGYRIITRLSGSGERGGLRREGEEERERESIQRAKGRGKHGGREEERGIMESQAGEGNIKQENKCKARSWGLPR